MGTTKILFQRSLASTSSAAFDNKHLSLCDQHSVPNVSKRLVGDEGGDVVDNELLELLVQLGRHLTCWGQPERSVSSQNQYSSPKPKLN
jgi:hypothetical protein